MIVNNSKWGKNKGEDKSLFPSLLSHNLFFILAELTCSFQIYVIRAHQHSMYIYIEGPISLNYKTDSVSAHKRMRPKII